MSAPTQERIGRFRLRGLAADALRYAHHHTVACPRCATEIHTRHPGPHNEGGPLHDALLDHLFCDCDATEATR